MEADEGLVLAADGTRFGRLLHGVLDLDVAFLSDKLLRGSRDAFTAGLWVCDQRAVESGFVCGGGVELLVQRLETVPAALWRAVEAGRPATVVTVCSGAAAGATAVVDDAGLHGDQRLADLGLDKLLARNAGLVVSSARQQTIFTAGEDLLVEVIVPKINLVVVGGGELSRALCNQGELVGWSVRKVDGLETALDAIDRLGPNDIVLVRTHMPSLDTPVLAKALRQGVGFVGAVGSHHTQARRAARLRAERVPDEWVANIHAPVGLDLGAASPAETAVAVVAEVLLTRSARSGLPLRNTTGRINA
jgi:xanthine dehydrogenase accessory factor